MLDGFRLVELLELSATRRLKVGRDVIVHCTTDLEPDDVVEIDGIRTTNLARTLADLGSVADADLVARRARRRASTAHEPPLDRADCPTHPSARSVGAGHAPPVDRGDPVG